MRRWRRWLAAVVLLVLFAFLLAPATAPGTQLLAALANRVPGVSLAGVEGRLLGVLQVERATVALPGLQLTLRGLRSRLRPACLPRGELCFGELAAQSLQLRLPEPGRGDAGGRPAPLPFPFRAERLVVGTLTLQAGDSLLAVEAVEAVEAASLRAGGRQVEAEQLAFGLERIGRATAAVTLTLDREWPLVIDGSFAPDAALTDRLPGDSSLLRPLSVIARGPPTALALAVDAAAAVPALGGRVRARARGTLRWPALDLERLRLDSPAGSVSARGDAEFAARRAGLAVTASNVAPVSATWPLAPASGSARLEVEFGERLRVALAALQLTSGWQGHALSVAGEGAWEPGMPLPRLGLTGVAAGLPWALEGGGGEALALSVDGKGGFTVAGITLDSLRADGELAADGGVLAFRGAAGGLQGDAASASELEVEGTVTLAAPFAFSARSKVQEVTVGTRTLETLDLVAEGNTAGGEARASVTGAVAGDLTVTAERGEKGRWNLLLEPLTLETPAGQLTRKKPLSLALLASPRRLRFPGHCWSLDDVSLCLAAAEAGSEGELVARLEGPLALRAGTFPSVAAARAALAGTVEARWGADRPPRVDAQLSMDGIRVTPAGRDKPLEDPGHLQLSLALHEQLSLGGELTGGALGAMSLAARRGSEGWRGELTVAGAPLAYLQPLLSGVALLDGTVRGKLVLAAPGPAFVTGGGLALEDGRLGLAASDAELEALALTLRPGEGGELVIAGSGRYGAGPVTIAGSLDPVTPRLSLSLEGKENAVHWPGLVDATVSPVLALGYADGTATLDGELRVHGGRLAPGQVGSGGIAVSPDAEIIGADARKPLLRTRIDLRILVEERFRVVGDLVDATIGGDLRLRQEPAGPPQLIGRVAVVGGELRAYGQQLELREGSMAFAGDPENPQLDLRAERQFPSEALRVGFAVGGSLREPRLALYSEPQVPREAQLSWLLRGRPPDAGASVDGTALALSVGATALNQTPLMRSLNRLPGLSNVALGTETGSTGTAATISGYVGDRLYLSYGMGLYEPVNTLTARLYLRARLWLEMVSALENSVDLYYRFDID
ncbi:translocation/assembly module TamB domain-containing protein [Pseudohaliea rubra]|uniref:Translocation and assembly module TamB C-terminal domain-containing protein n=1 Tax=Pseudohaliea rubra DSM 19751 TaxID=1265313 RepID=A0A095XX65_9GAMM|nr:translocation/assembly module TamB domain-containing protein [Pseudohaliea rubra]KGE04291.1 hypothetical protein HRUBRA_01155 [Pseudohaliea rubra DSM 19751]